MDLMLDTGIVGQLCHPRNPKNRSVAEWFSNVADGTVDLSIYLPEIADYELRRKLLHLIQKKQATRKSVNRLDKLGRLLEFVPINSAIMKRAAEIWAEARSMGVPTAGESSLDGDVILAAQAESVSARVVTNNTKHISRYVAAVEWADLKKG